GQILCHCSPAFLACPTLQRARATLVPAPFEIFRTKKLLMPFGSDATVRNTRSYRGLNRSRWRLGKSLSRHRISHWLRGVRLASTAGRVSSDGPEIKKARPRAQA